MDSLSALFQLLRCDTTDMREIVVRGLGRTNPEAFKFVDLFIPSSIILCIGISWKT